MILKYIVVKNKNYEENGPFPFLVQEDIAGGDYIAAFDIRQDAEDYVRRKEEENSTENF